MKRVSHKHWISRWLVVVAVLLSFALSGRTQQGGNGSFVMGNGDDLIGDQHLPGALGSYGFATRVGGLAFGATAVAARAGLALVSVEYHPELADGGRLVATVDDGATRRKVTVAAPDWALVPVASYASGGQHAAMTLFGKMQDATDDAWMHQNGYDIINFERSFKDTLLGLRLFHADVLILANASADLPRTAKGYLLGTGEQLPDVPANTTALDALWTSIQSYGTQPFQSYIITDRGAGVTFDTTDTQLTLQGLPYWYCWREVPMSADARTALWQEANDYANAQLYAEEVEVYNQLGWDAFHAIYTDAYEQQRFDAIFDEYISPRLLQPLPEVSDAISSEVASLGGINPAVYRALTQTMQLSALFRLAKANDAAAYARFTQSLAAVVPTPCLRTPAGYAPHSDLILPDAVLDCPPASNNGTGGASSVGGAGSTTTSSGTTASGGTQDNGGTSTMGNTSASGGLPAATASSLVTGGVGTSNSVSTGGSSAAPAGGNSSLSSTTSGSASTAMSGNGGTAASTATMGGTTTAGNTNGSGGTGAATNSTLAPPGTSAIAGGTQAMSAGAASVGGSTAAIVATGTGGLSLGNTSAADASSGTTTTWIGTTATSTAGGSAGASDTTPANTQNQSGEAGCGCLLVGKRSPHSWPTLLGCLLGLTAFVRTRRRRVVS